MKIKWLNQRTDLENYDASFKLRFPETYLKLVTTPIFLYCFERSVTSNPRMFCQHGLVITPGNKPTHADIWQGFEVLQVNFVELDFIAPFNVVVANGKCHAICETSRSPYFPWKIGIFKLEKETNFERRFFFERPFTS